jgi:NAD(P)-dependent dehydrogenase (short-subunit alcohol dehydrogenase family)
MDVVSGIVRSGRRAVVTGAASGIGVEVSETLVAQAASTVAEALQ